MVSGDGAKCWLGVSIFSLSPFVFSLYSLVVSLSPFIFSLYSLVSSLSPFIFSLYSLVFSPGFSNGTWQVGKWMKLVRGKGYRVKDSEFDTCHDQNG